MTDFNPAVAREIWRVFTTMDLEDTAAIAAEVGKGVTAGDVAYVLQTVPDPRLAPGVRDGR